MNGVSSMDCWLKISQTIRDIVVSVLTITGGLSIVVIVAAIIGGLSMNWFQISQIFQNIAVGLAAIIGGVGGIWAIYRWLLERGHETSLEIDLDSTCTVYRNDLYLVFIDVSLKNVGKVRVVAKKKKYNGKITEPVYNEDETINHSLGLQLRAIRSDIDCSAALDWFSSNMLDTPQNIPNEINLFSELEKNEQDKQDEIMMEPGTTNNFGYPFILPAGHYLAKVTFVGKRSIDFWRRLFYIHVPALEK
jgi:hypothetical protein